METKLFALKITKREKEAMDYTAKETSRTLSKLYYKSLQNTIYETLGIVLLYKIDRRISGGLIELKSLNLDDENTTKLNFPILEDFVEFMIEPNNRHQFNEIFENIDFIVKDFLLYKLNIKEIARAIGRLYIEKNGNFSKTDLVLARQIFFEYMLSLYYKLTAIGSLKNLNTEWYNKRSKIKEFELKLISSYLNKYREVKAEAIKIEEVFEVSEYKG